MGSIPIQRATDPDTLPGTRPGQGARPTARFSLDSEPAAPAEARRVVREALAEWSELGLLGACGFCGANPGGRTGAAVPGQAADGDGEDAGGRRRERAGAVTGCLPGRHSMDLLADDAALVTDELVTNAVVHAGTTVDVCCRLQECRPPGVEGPDDEPPALLLEVSDHHPSRAPADPGGPYGKPASATDEYGRGLRIVASLAECWGVTYRSGLKTVWARLSLDGRSTSAQPSADGEDLLTTGVRPAVRDEAEWRGHGALSFLAETSDLLAGQLDEELVASLAGQLLVPRLADWCAVWLEGTGAAGSGQGRTASRGQGGGATGGGAPPPRPVEVRHTDESRLDQLRTALEKKPPDPPSQGEPVSTVPVNVAWPGSDPDPAEDPADAARQPDDPARPAGDPVDEGSSEGVALYCRLVTNGRSVGTLLLGRAGRSQVPDEVVALVEDFARRVALAIGAARRYTRQATISRVLQRGLLPSQVARIPGVSRGLVYEPSDEGLAGGDFYDVFHSIEDRWCFMLGDVQGSGPEAAVVTGLARPWLRLLGREGYQVGEVLDRLNRLLLDDATETAEAASAMAAEAAAAAPEEGIAAGVGIAAEVGVPSVTGITAAQTGVPESSQPRFLSLLYGELVPLPVGGKGGGARCTLASAGHPLPLLLRPDGTVRAAAESQLLLGIADSDDVRYESQSFDLEPGDTLLCVTDGVTERRSGGRMLDDEDGLARVLADCVGLTADEVAERVRKAVHDFDDAPPDDDLALLVFQAD